MNSDWLHSMLDIPLLVLAVASPLLLAVLASLTWRSQWSRLLPGAALPALIASLWAMPGEVIRAEWFFMGGRMGLDETGRIFLSLTSFIWLLAGCSCQRLLADATNHRRFSLSFLLCMTGNFGLILAHSLLDYYLFFALMSFSAYCLVTHTESAYAMKAGHLYLILLMIGEVALFTGVLVLAHDNGTLEFSTLGAASCRPLVLMLFFIGFGVKIGALPMHSWMAPSYQAAPIPAAAALAGAMVTAGILGWLRFLPPALTACPQGAGLFLTTGASAALYGVITGLHRDKAGEVLGCSSISQMGLITALFGLGLLDRTTGQLAAPLLMMYTVHHSLAKSCLFFACNLDKDERSFVSRLQTAVILLPALALAGLPYTSGAVVKTGYKELAASLGPPWPGLSTVFLPATSIATTMLMLHFIDVLRRQPKRRPATTADKAVFAVSLLTTATLFWFWPPTGGGSSILPAAKTFWPSLWPILCGSLLFYIWRRIAVLRKATERRGAESSRIVPAVAAFCQKFVNKAGQRRQSGNLTGALRRLQRQLRLVEKIIGRWKVVGIAYLVLCFCLLFLLL